MLPVFSVSQFIEQINEIIAGEFIIEGEVSQYKISQGKWVFFDIKDDQSVLNCFASVFNLRTPLEDGMKVKILGYPSIYAKSGRFSFTVQRIEMVGEGTLKRSYELLKQALAKEGLFATERKRKLPRIPKRIGVIASRDSAAFGDFKRILNNRWGGVEVMLRHVAVQGESAIADIIQAFREFNECSIQCDEIVLIRGGGSLEDLAAFNAEEVVRAIYSSRTPVVCGVGHERDETLADLVADVRASTPSNAAEIVVPDRKEFSKGLDFEIQTMGETLVHTLRLLRRAVEDPRVHMLSAIESLLASRTQFVRSAEVLFKNVDPKQVLRRGFSITREPTGKLIRDAAQVDVGSEVVIEFTKGTARSRIISTK